MTATTTLSRLTPLAIDTQGIAERLRQSVVAVQNGSGGAGAGVIWSPDGLIVTNDHVVPGSHVQISLANGDRARGRVVGRDQENDLAAVQVDRDHLPAAPLGDATGLRPGQLVLAIGHPFGLRDALTLGIVSALPEPGEPRELIRADLTLGPGNSGGPLADAHGRVIGINAMVASPGIALAVPTHLVSAFLARAAGPTPWLGITAIPVVIPRHQQRGFGASVGLLLTAIEAGSPAAAAGLQPGDVLVAFGDQPLRHPNDLQSHLLQAGPDGDLALTVVRGGRRSALTVRVGRREPQIPSRSHAQQAA